MVFAALTLAAFAALGGGNPSFIQSYRVVLGKLGALVELVLRQWGAVVLLAITIVGIPFAIRLLVRWSFGTQAVVLDGLGAKGAIASSCRLVEGRWWRVAGAMLLTGLAFATPVIVMSILWWRPYSTATRITESGLSLIFGPIAAIFWTQVFLHLRGAAEPTAAIP